MSSASYLAHFGCKDAPFSKEIPDAELWLPSSKLAIVDSLLEALDEHASVVLVGEPGVGKTCVLRALRHRIPAAGFKLTYCHMPRSGAATSTASYVTPSGSRPRRRQAASSTPSADTSRTVLPSAFIPCLSSTRRTCCIRTRSSTYTSC
jgi:type II secretory pathway predicted ATPase ExeA